MTVLFLECKEDTLTGKTGYHQTTNHKFSSQLGSKHKNKKFKQFKFISKAKQGVYAGVFKGVKFDNDIYFLLRPLLHCVLAGVLSEVSQSMKQIVVGCSIKSVFVQHPGIAEAESLL